MTEKTIKDVLAEIIKDRRVNAREALDMNDKQILFIGKCYDDSISFYDDINEYEDEDEGNATRGLGFHRFKNLEGTEEIAGRELLELFNNGKISHESHHIVRFGYENYDHTYNFLVTRKSIILQKERELLTFKEDMRKKMEDHLESLNLKEKIVFFEVFNHYTQEEGYLLYDREFTLFAYWNYLKKNKKGNYCSVSWLQLNEDTLELEKQQLGGRN